MTRTDLYKEFIVSGKDPIERGYDINKPYVGEVKELIDLSYNSYLADALGGYLLTPLDCYRVLLCRNGNEQGSL